MPKEKKGDGTPDETIPSPVDYQKLVQDIATEVLKSLPPAPNIDDIATKIEPKLAVKFVGALQNMKADINKAIQDVANNQHAEAEAVFKANIQGLAAEMAKQVKERPAAAENAGDRKDPISVIDHLIERLLELIPVGIDAYVKLRPSPPTEQIVAQTIASSFKYANWITRLQKAAANGEDLDKAIKSYLPTSTT